MKKEKLTQRKKQIFIAYYYNRSGEQDAEIYIGETGSDKEFIKYFKMVENVDLNDNDDDDEIVGIYPIKEEMGIDGKMYKIIIK